MVDEIADRMRSPLILIMKTSVTPGIGVGLMRNLLKDRPVTYVSNPEFLRTGQSIEDWYRSSRVMIGCDNESAVQTMLRLYHDIKAPWAIKDITSSGMIEYTANSFVATGVSFIYEVANLCEKVDANIDDVIPGMGLDPRIGLDYLQPGAGYGGLCQTKDTLALEFLASERCYEFKILRATIEANVRQREIIVNKLKNALGTLRGREIAVLGIAFKPGTDDIAAAPAIAIIKMLTGEGAYLRVYDPVAMENVCRVLPVNIKYAPDTGRAVSGASAIVLLTEWPKFIDADWSKLKETMLEPYVFLDGRNAFPQNKLQDAGFKYISMGRNHKRTIKIP